MITAQHITELRKVVRAIRRAGHLIAIRDLEEGCYYKASPRQTEREILHEAQAVDACILSVYTRKSADTAAERYVGAVLVMWDAEPFEVIVDYSESLEAFMPPVHIPHE